MTLTDDQIRKEITDFEVLYKQITGKEVGKYFRFPYGHYNPHNLSLVSEYGLYFCVLVYGYAGLGAESERR